MNFSDQYLDETIAVLKHIDTDIIEKIVEFLWELRELHGRIFFVGIGGSSANCDHAVNDFRKIAEIDAYSLTSNVAELTARINDDGFENCFSSMMDTHYLSDSDAIFVLSVGGGNLEKNISVPIISLIQYAETIDCPILGIVGKDGGYTKQHARDCIVIPPAFTDRITPHTEEIQSVILHLIVSHPMLKVKQTKWEECARSNK